MTKPFAKSTHPNRMISTYQLAERWGLHYATLERWRKEGKGPAWVQIEGRIRYPLDRVKQYELAHEVKRAQG